MYRQELLEDTPEYKVTLLIRPPDADPLEVDEDIRLPGGSYLLWFTFPGAWHEVAAFHDPSGRLVGYYANVIHPADLADPPAPGRRAGSAGPGRRRSEGRNAARWRIRDLFLDVWTPPHGPPRVLDEEEFEEARRRGWIDEEEAERAEAERDRILARAAVGRWPPDPVPRRALEAVPFLRLRRDDPGTYWAALLAGRIIGYGLYLLGAICVTSLAFAAATNVLEPGGAHEWWIAAIAAEAGILLPLALSGRLPATRWPRPAPTDERTFFLGTVAAGVAVLVVQDADVWRELLAGLYATLGLFLLLFAVCRTLFERRLPMLALTGCLLSAVALVVLL